MTWWCPSHKKPASIHCLDVTLYYPICWICRGLLVDIISSLLHVCHMNTPASITWMGKTICSRCYTFSTHLNQQFSASLTMWDSIWIFGESGCVYGLISRKGSWWKSSFWKRSGFWCHLLSFPRHFEILTCSLKFAKSRLFQTYQFCKPWRNHLCHKCL